MTAPNVEVRTVETAIRCADGRIHYDTTYCEYQDPSELLALADRTGRTYLNLNDPLRECGPHFVLRT